MQRERLSTTTQVPSRWIQSSSFLQPKIKAWATVTYALHFSLDWEDEIEALPVVVSLLCVGESQLKPANPKWWIHRRFWKSDLIEGYVPRQ